MAVQRVPADRRPGRLLTELDQLTRTGRATATWWDGSAVSRDGRKAPVQDENALMHGGPLAPATVEAVAEFAENLANEALAASIEGSLLGQSQIDYFLDRESRLSEMQERLRANEPARQKCCSPRLTSRTLRCLTPDERLTPEWRKVGERPVARAACRRDRQVVVLGSGIVALCLKRGG